MAADKASMAGADFAALQWRILFKSLSSSKQSIPVINFSQLGE
jgi:hypothetical protein